MMLRRLVAYIRVVFLARVVFLGLLVSGSVLALAPIVEVAEVAEVAAYGAEAPCCVDCPRELGGECPPACPDCECHHGRSVAMHPSALVRNVGEPPALQRSESAKRPPETEHPREPFSIGIYRPPRGLSAHI